MAVSYCESVVDGGIRWGRDEGYSIVQKPVVCAIGSLMVARKREEEKKKGTRNDHAH